MVELVRTTKNASFADFEASSASPRLPLAVCWMIWIAASAGLWFAVLRTTAFLF
jgi:hypothetical protein